MPRTTLVTRIESHLKDRLGEAASAQNRTTSNLVEWLIKQYLDQNHPEIKPSEAALPTLEDTYASSNP